MTQTVARVSGAIRLQLAERFYDSRFVNNFYTIKMPLVSFMTALVGSIRTIMLCTLLTFDGHYTIRNVMIQIAKVTDLLHVQSHWILFLKESARNIQAITLILITEADEGEMMVYIGNERF
ncbi:hypothetical protein Droror1_Dr00016151 [Drosera rotundifolia]